MAEPTPTYIPPSIDDDGARIPRGVAPGTTAHAVLCTLCDSPTESLEAIARELGVEPIQVYAACARLRYHGLLEGRYGTRSVTNRGRTLVRATVKGARV